MILLFIILIIHSIILTRLQFFPYPELFIYPYLTNKGLLPYQQILDQHFPGLLFLPINFNSLGMTTPEVSRVWLIGIVIVTHILLFLTAKLILRDDKKAILVNFLYLLWQPFFEGWVLWIDNFIPLFLLPAFYFSLKRKYFYTGLAIGLAVIFKQTVVPLSILIGILILYDARNIKSLISYLIGLIFPISFMIFYFFNLGVFYDFWYWTITFNLTVYAKFGTSIPQTVGFVTRVLLVYLSSFFVFFFKEKRVVLMFFVFLVGSLAGVFDRADFIHFQPSLPFAVLGTVLGFEVLNKKTFFKALILVYCFVGIWWQGVFYKGHLSSKILFFDKQTYDIADKIKEYTSSGDKIFVYGGAPHLYFLSDTLPSGDIFIFQFPWFLKVAEGRILEGIKKDQPKIVIYDTGEGLDRKKVKDFSKEISNYIETNYKKIDSVNSVDILERINQK